MPSFLPARNGVNASALQLPPGRWNTVLECLCAHFPAISRERWADRVARGLVLNASGLLIDSQTPYRVGLDIFYYREVAAEMPIPFVETVLHVDEHLVVADKPHFLPVTPGGIHVVETLLARLIRRIGNPDLVPLHRIDRGTAGLVLFSADRGSRAKYQSLFRERRIVKYYEALAAPLPQWIFPLTRTSRIETGEPFFRMREVDGVVNAQTRIEVIAREREQWRYALYPISGCKHQLRVHMAALGAPIINDDFYPLLASASEGKPTRVDCSRPLKLLAKRLSFTDPVSGTEHDFESRMEL